MHRFVFFFYREIMAGTSSSYDKYRPLTEAELALALEDAVREVEEYRNLPQDDPDSEDHESVSDHNTDTEEESEDEPEVEGVSDDEEAIQEDHYTGRDKTSKWEKNPPPPSRTRRQNIITHLPGSIGAGRNVVTPEAAFALFFDDEVINILVENTNIYIDTKVRENYANQSQCRETNYVEIKALLGLLIMSGVLRASHLNYKDLFAQNDIGHHFFSSVMSYKRFLFLLACVRFDDLRTRIDRLKSDKLAAIRSLFEHIVQQFSLVFRPSEYVTIDEQLVGFRGHCSFRQYLPNKPNKYGIKIFAMVDARNFYCSKMEVYTGKQPDGPYAVSNSPEDIVCRLIEPIHNTGRNVTVDNWYTSIPLAIRLLHDHRLTLVGTIRKNKAQIPPAFQANKDRQQFSTIFGFTKEMTLLSYVPKKRKAVMLLSTFHNSDTIDPSTYDQKKPEVLTFYNLTKGGVDTADKLCATYNVGRRTRRWPMVLFFHLLNTSAINARVICISNTDNSFERSTFLKQLAHELVRPLQIIRSQDSHIPKNIRKRLREELNIPEEPIPEQPAGQRKRCYYCPWSRNRSTKQICFKCHKNACGEHLRNICLKCLQEEAE